MSFNVTRLYAHGFQISVFGSGCLLSPYTGFECQPQSWDASTKLAWILARLYVHEFWIPDRQSIWIRWVYHIYLYRADFGHGQLNIQILLSSNGFKLVSATRSSQLTSSLLASWFSDALELNELTSAFEPTGQVSLVHPLSGDPIYCLKHTFHSLVVRSGQTCYTGLPPPHPR